MRFPLVCTKNNFQFLYTLAVKQSRKSHIVCYPVCSHAWTIQSMVGSIFRKLSCPVYWNCWTKPILVEIERKQRVHYVFFLYRAIHTDLREVEQNRRGSRIREMVFRWRKTLLSTLNGSVMTPSQLFSRYNDYLPTWNFSVRFSHPKLLRRKVSETLFDLCRPCASVCN